MTVKELIQQLQNMPPEQLVVIRGLEGGVDEVSDLENVRVALDVNEDWYYGAHEILDPRDHGDPQDEIVKAIHLRNGVGDNG